VREIDRKRRIPSHKRERLSRVERGPTNGHRSILGVYSSSKTAAFLVFTGTDRTGSDLVERDVAPEEQGGAPPWAGFRYVMEPAPSIDGRPFHLNNLTIAELLFNARNSYITQAVGMVWQDLFDTGRNMIMRRLEIDYEREAAATASLKVGIRAAKRSRRTLTFEEIVCQVDPPSTIAVGRSVHVVVRFDAPGAIELPEDVVRRYEAYEQRPLQVPAAG
jgi:acyl-CoA thioesterase FadM